MDQCDQHADGKHVWGPRKRRLHMNIHPTVKENWRSYIGCICGAEAPPDEEAKARKAMRETRELRSRAWGKEPAEQLKLPF